MRITRSGTLRNIPVIPHNFPINDKKINKAKGLMFKVFPISFVSKKFPIQICENINVVKVISGSDKFIN